MEGWLNGETYNLHTNTKRTTTRSTQHSVVIESPAAMVTAEYATRAGKAVESANKTQ